MARPFTEQELEFIRKVKELCLQNYNAGGDTIIECFEDSEIVTEFDSLEEVKAYCGIQVEQALNHRWGEDSDPELERARKWREANWGE